MGDRSTDPGDKLGELVKELLAANPDTASPGSKDTANEKVASYCLYNVHVNLAR